MKVSDSTSSEREEDSTTISSSLHSSSGVNNNCRTHLNKNNMTKANNNSFHPESITTSKDHASLEKDIHKDDEISDEDRNMKNLSMKSSLLSSCCKVLSSCSVRDSAEFRQYRHIVCRQNPLIILYSFLLFILLVLCGVVLTFQLLKDESNGASIDKCMKAGIIVTVVLSAAISVLYCIILVEKERNKMFLYSMIPRKFAQKLKQDHDSTLQSYEMVTVVLIDIVVSKTVAERQPRKVMNVLHEINCELEDLVASFRLHKHEKNGAGKTYIVIGGMPSLSKDDTIEVAEKVVLFALEAKKVMYFKNGLFNEEVFSMDVGIGSGPLSAGAVMETNPSSLVMLPKCYLFGPAMALASQALQLSNIKHSAYIQCCEMTSQLLSSSTNKKFNLNEDKPATQDQITRFWRIEGVVHANGAENKTLTIARNSMSHISSTNDVNRDSTKDVAVTLDFEQQGYGSQINNKNSSQQLMIQHLTFLLNYRYQSHFNISNVAANNNINRLMHLYVSKIEAFYEDVAYHNFQHAFHVTHSLNRLVDIVSIHSAPGSVHAINTDTFTHFCLIFAALIHDVCHRGLPNFIFIKQGDELAKKYRNTSIMEKYSIEKGMEILMEDDFIDLRQALFPKEIDFVKFQQIVYSTILCTDIFCKDRMDMCKDRWNIAFGDIEKDNNSSKSVNGVVMSLMAKNLLQGVRYLTVSGDGSKYGDSVTPFTTPINDIDIHQFSPFSNDSQDATALECLQKSVFIEHMIQVADVAHNFQAWDIFVKFNYRLVDELYSCHKTTGIFPDVTKTWFQGQVSFFDDYVIPLSRRFQKCCAYMNIEQSNFLLEGALRNRARWLKEGKKVCDVFEDTIKKNYESNGRIDEETVMAMVLR